MDLDMTLSPLFFRLLSMPLGTGESRKTLLEQSGDSHCTNRIDVSILE